MKTNTRRMLGVSAAVLSLMAGSAYGQWIGPTYTPPGGVTWTDLGGISPAHAGGKTWQVDTLDLGASLDLYFGVHSDYYPALGINGLDPHMTYSAADSDLVNGKAVWTGSITIPLAVGGPTTTRDAKYTLSLSDLSDNPLGMIDSTTVSGFPTLPQGILHVTDPAGFKMNQLFEVEDGGGFNAALAVYDALPTVQGNQMWSSVSGAFYAVIPEPGVVSMLAVCAGGLWVIRRRFV